MSFSRIAVVISLLVFALGGCAAARGTSPLGLEAPIEQAAINFSADVTEGRYLIVTTADLRKWLDEKREIILISTLPAALDRELGVIPGALSAPMPLTAKELAPEDREHMLMAAGNNKERIVVVYCDCVACRRSHLGAKMLVDNGYRNVYRYPAGITGWVEAGNQVIKCKGVMCRP